MNTAPDIVCIATRSLDNPMPTNVQHLMLRLAAKHRVLYVEPPVDPWFLARNRRVKTLPTVIEKPDRMAIFTPLVLPWANRSGRIAAWNRRIVAGQIRRRLRRLGFDQPMLWLFSPRDEHLLGNLGEADVCYHVTDDYTAMPTVTSTSLEAAVRDAQARILSLADHVFVTSRQLAADHGIAGPNVSVVPNVADVEHFSRALLDATEVPEDIARLRRPIAGFVGAVHDYKVDFELLAECARSSPEISWVLIGPGGWGDGSSPPATGPANIHLLGPRPYALLPAYMKVFDVALIPYRINDYTRYCSPLKLYEYLATGTAVVATDIPAVRDAGEVVRVAGDAVSFMEAVRGCLAEADSTRQARIDVAAAHSWSARIDELERTISRDAPDGISSISNIPSTR